MADLFTAFDQNDIIKIKELLDNGADINAKRTYGNSMLTASCFKGDVEMIKFLVSNGADINATNDYGWTSLMIAAEFKNNAPSSLLIYLLENGADIKRKNNDGNTALGHTLRFYKTKKERCDLLLEYKHEGTDTNSHKAILATIKNDHKTLEALLDSGLSVNCKNYDDVSLLHIAAFFNHKKIMQMLLERGANINDKVSFGETALLCSTYRNSLDCFNLLLANKADISIGNNINFTPLMSAACHNYVEMTKILLSKGASIDSRANDGTTALLYCSQWGAINCAELLIHAGANICSITNKGEQILDLAASNKRIKAFLYFYQKGAPFNGKKLEPVLYKIPKFLFAAAGSESILSQCRSPINVLNVLYKNDKRGGHSSILSRLIKSFFNEPLDTGVLAYLLVFLNSLEIAARKNLLEKTDLNEKILQLDTLLAELFKTDSLDNGDNMLELLFPNLSKLVFDKYHLEISKLSWLDPMILLKTRKYEQLLKAFQALHRAHTIFCPGGVLFYCLKNEIKSVFRHPQISSVVQEVYKTTLAPPQKEMIEMGGNYEIIYFQNKGNSVLLNFMNSYLNDILSGSENVNVKLIEKLYGYQNIRYCPKNMILFEASSKLLTLILITLFSLHTNIAGSSNTLAGFIISHIIGVVFYEIGKMKDLHYNMKEYFKNGWNVLDLGSALAIFISLLLLITNLDPSFLTINGTFVPPLIFATSAIPLSLSLLQSASLIKPVGELVIMIGEMVYDIASFFAVYIICTYGFAVVVAVVAELTVVESLLFLYSATLGNFNIIGVNPYLELLVAIYMLSSAILLINLLIARMSTTYQRINDKALQEWSYAFAKTVKSYILITEKSPSSMLPAPLNWCTISFSMVHYSMLKKEISVGGTVADAVLLIFGEIFSFFHILYIVIDRFHLTSARAWRKGQYFKYFTYPIAIPLFLIIMTVLHYFVTIWDCSFLRVQSDDGMIIGFEPHLKLDRYDTLGVNFHHSEADSCTTNPINNNGKNVEMTAKSTKYVNRIDSLISEDANDIKNSKEKIVFNEDDIKRIIRTLNVESSSNIIETIFEMEHKNELKIEMIEASINEIKQMLLLKKQK